MSLTNVVLPQPLRPTKAIIFPGAKSSVMLLKILGASGPPYLKLTFRNSIHSCARNPSSGLNMISLMSTLPAKVALGSSVYVHWPPANAFGVGVARSTMSCPLAQRTFTRPLVGGGNPNVYGPAPDPFTERAGVPLIKRSPALTLVTGSVNVMRTCVSERTVMNGAGSNRATAGAKVSGVV